MFLSLLSNFLLMGLQTISCFHLSYWFDLWPSHCLSWVEKLRIYRFSHKEEAVKKKEILTRLLWYHWNLLPSFLLLYKFNSTQFCIWLYWQARYSGSNCLFNQMKPSVYCSGRSCLQNLSWCCIQAPCFHLSYLLIAIFFGGVLFLNRAVSGFLRLIMIHSFLFLDNRWMNGFTSIK